MESRRYTACMHHARPWGRTWVHTQHSLHRTVRCGSIVLVSMRGETLTWDLAKKSDDSVRAPCVWLEQAALKTPMPTRATRRSRRRAATSCALNGAHQQDEGRQPKDAPCARAVFQNHVSPRCDGGSFSVACSSDAGVSFAPPGWPGQLRTSLRATPR